MSAASEVRRAHRAIIAEAEARAARDVARGVEDLRRAIEAERWDRQVLEGHLRRIELPAAADVDDDVG